MSLARNLSAEIPVPQNAALFLDIDGTLAPIAKTPDMAKIPDDVLSTISKLYKNLDGALALVSGRSIKSVDEMTFPKRYPVAGQHGLEIRINENRILTNADHKRIISEISTELEPLHQAYPNLLLEYKGLSIAVHYRNAPAMQGFVERYLGSVVAPHSNYVKLQGGKMVYEIRIKDMDKGKAIQAFLQSADFKDKTPVFIGDDVTDEDGFKTVNEIGGISIKIGGGDTAAKYRLESTEELKTWLHNIQSGFENE